MSLLRRIGLIVAVLVGALLGAAVVFGFVSLDVPLLAAGALAGAVLYGGLWLRQGRTRDRRLAAVLLVVPVVLVVAFAAGTVYALYSAGQMAVPTDDRAANFDRLWSAVRDVYPYFDQKGLDWEAAGDRYRPLVEAAASDTEYHTLVAELLAELQDGHTRLSWPFPQQAARFGTLMEIEGRAVIEAVGQIGREAGLARGDVVVALDGLSIDEAIARLPARFRASSTPWNTRAWALQNLLTAWGDARALEVTLEDAGGETRRVTLAVPTETEAAGSQPAAPIISGYALPSGYGVIRIPQFYGASRAELVAQFDVALAALPDAPGLIFDLRGNGGGSSLTASEMAGRFLQADFVYAREYYQLRLPSRMWLGNSPRTVYPRAPYDGRPLVILTDALVVSSAEEFVLMLVDSGRARTVGRVTGGSSGNPLVFPLTGDGEAQFSSGDLRRINGGQRIEGAGIQPDAAVNWTLADVRDGRDPDITAAETLLAAGAASG